MSTGEGILWATILLLISAGVFSISKKRKWNIVAKAASVSILLGIVIAVGVFIYSKYQERPLAQTGIYGVELGTLPVEVKLALGEPVYEGNSENPKTSEQDVIFLYKEYTWEDKPSKYIRFTKKNGEYRAYLICDLALTELPFGFYSWTTLDEATRKLGHPSHESIRSDGLAKMLSFGKFNVSVVFEKNEVTSICVTDNDHLSFLEEYQSEPI